MRVTEVRYSRVLSDRMYGNHQASVTMAVGEQDDPAEAMAEAKHLATLAVQPGFDATRPESVLSAGTGAEAPEVLGDYIDDPDDPDDPDDIDDDDDDDLDGDELDDRESYDDELDSEQLAEFGEE